MMVVALTSMMIPLLLVVVLGPEPTLATVIMDPTDSCEKPSRVCGNGLTYRDKCEAIIQGVQTYYPGNCDKLRLSLKKCHCARSPQAERPVCARETNFYNGCHAVCKGKRDYQPGNCAKTAGLNEPCVCTEDYQPVCAKAMGVADGVTFGNVCQAKCAGFTKQLIKKGKC